MSRNVLSLLLLFAGLATSIAAAPLRTAPYASPFTSFNPRDRYWLRAIQEVYDSVAVLQVRHQSEKSKGLSYSKLMRGDPMRRQVAITFDDGPHPDFTRKILGILRSYHVKATFFVVGEMAEQHPELVRAEATAGHTVGNHTYHHVNLTTIPPQYVALEIQACSDVVKAITGRQTVVFRPPGGDYDSHVAQVANHLGQTMVLWTDDPGDYASPGVSLIKRRLLERLSNGGIILLHDGIKETVDLLPWLLQTLSDRGYEVVTVDQMMASSHVSRGVRPGPASAARN